MNNEQSRPMDQLRKLVMRMNEEVHKLGLHVENVAFIPGPDGLDMAQVLFHVDERAFKDQADLEVDETIREMELMMRQADVEQKQEAAKLGLNELLKDLSEWKEDE